MGLVIKYCLAGIIGVFFFHSNAEAQTLSSGQSPSDSTGIVHERRSAGVIEVAHGWRTNVDHFHGFFFRAFYEAQIGRTFLNAGAFSYNKFDDGFGFDFRLRVPMIQAQGGSLSFYLPLGGLGFTVWPVTKPTVTVGFPVGFEYEFFVVDFMSISINANMAPQITLNSDNNTVIFDVRLGIRFD
jgi:hypothetical protein